MIQALRNAWRLPDVRNKLLFTGFILIVYQFAAHVPVVGVDRNVLRQVFESGSSAGNLIQVMNLLSGGAVSEFQRDRQRRLPLHYRIDYLPIAGANCAGALNASSASRVGKKKSNATPTMSPFLWLFCKR